VVAAELGGPAWPKVIIVDETMREGMQIESADIPLEAKVELLNALARTGLGHIVVGSFVSPKWTPQMANVDALLDQFQPAEGVRYTALALNPKGRQRMERYMPPLAGPLGLPRTLVHLCDVFVRRNTNRSQQDEIAEWASVIGQAVDEGAESAGIAINAAWGSNWVGPFDDAHRLRMLQAQHDAWTAAGIPVDRVWIGDPMAWNMPHHVTSTLRSIKQRWPAITTFHLHLHNARGSAPISAYAALTTLDAGDTLILDTAVGGMGGCPYCGHGRLTQMIPTEDLVDLLEDLGIPTGVDLAELLKVARLAELVVGHELWGHVSKAGPRPRGEDLFAMDMPFIETPEQAQHFWRGSSAYTGAISPWPAPIVSPMRAAAEARGGQSDAGGPAGNGSPTPGPGGA
jgi:hydroxymethylglutaryl-CoA lyase